MVRLSTHPASPANPSRYQSHLRARPFTTQVLTTAVLFTAGDMLAQQAVERRGRAHSWARTARMTAYGGCVFGPAATLWMRALAGRVRTARPATTVAARVALDQLLFTPANLACFLGGMAWLEGADVKGRLREAYLPVLRTNWMVWPLVQAVNFAVVPLEHRVLVVNVVALGWNCYLSYMNAKG